MKKEMTRFQKTRKSRLPTRKTGNTQPPSPTNKSVATIQRIAVDKPPDKTKIINSKELLEEREATTDQSDETTGCPYVNVKLKGHKTKLLVDTGAEITIISEHVLRGREQTKRNIR